MGDLGWLVPMDARCWLLGHRPERTRVRAAMAFRRNGKLEFRPLDGSAGIWCLRCDHWVFPPTLPDLRLNDGEALDHIFLTRLVPEDFPVVGG